MTKWRAYPAVDSSDNVYYRTPIQRIKSDIQSLLDARKTVGRVADIQLIGDFHPLQSSDLAAVVVARNELAMFPSFLAHYRGLGVSRFIVLDDRSDDGSVDFLLSQPDVDVWMSSLRYLDTDFGDRWREALIEQYGIGRWYLNLDADEYLIYDQSENRSLAELISALEAENRLRLSAPMIDLYPVGSVDAASFSGAGVMPWEVADHFDRSGYRLNIRRQHMSITGGPRHRKFGLTNQLIKSPLLFWDSRTSMKSGIHKPLPYGRNFGAIAGVLLHFKFFADLRKEVDEAIADNQHFNDAKEYRAIADALSKNGSLNFHGEVSERYIGPQQMIDLGFMQAIWSGR